jgi:TGF-beta propeptide
MLRVAGVLAVLLLVMGLLGGCGEATRTVAPGDTPGDVGAAVVTLRPVADTELRQGDPASNFGLDQIMALGRGAPGQAHRDILRFSLRGIPATAVVNNAVLRLYVSDTTGQEVDRFSVHRVTANWTEATATWNNMAANYSPTMLAIRSVGPGAVGTWVTWNITGLVQSWVKTPTRNFGCLVRGTEGSQQLVLYVSSRQHALAGQRPRLIIDYTP